MSSNPVPDETSSSSSQPETDSEMKTTPNLKRPSEEPIPGAPKRKRLCFRCKEEGHFSTECVKTLTKVTPLCRVALGNSIYVVGVPHRREPLIHIRYYNGDKATEDGIVLTLGRWKELERHAEEMDTRVNAYDNESEETGTCRQHLGGNWYVSVTKGFPCVDIRKFWIPPDSEKLAATRKGLSLGFAEWKNLVDNFKEIERLVPDLKDTVVCYQREDHQNQMGALRCPECNPNHFMNW